MNYEKDIYIDSEALDVEWLEQPRLMLNYSQHLAEQRKLLDESKQSLDVAKAEADKKIRTNPEKYGIEKITEAVVGNAILIEKGYQQAYTEYLEAKYETDMAQAAVSAFEQRKYALENLVKLFIAQYFAGPNVPRDLTKEWQKKQDQKESDKKVGGMKRKNRE